MSSFRQERWSLHVTFDPIEVQKSRLLDWDGGDLFALESWLIQDFGGMPEEYGEMVRSTGDGSIEITCDTIEWMSKVADWVIMHTVPREMRLVRNDER